MMFRSYLRDHRIGFAIAIVFCVAAPAFGALDMGGAVTLAMGAALPADEILKNALSEHGLQLKNFADKLKEYNERIMDLEQKRAQKPGFGSSGPGALANAIAAKAAAYGGGVMEIPVPHAHVRNAIVGDQDNSPLVAPDRRSGVVFGAQRRLTIRDLFTAVPTSSNLIEFARETAFTNNAAIQGAGGSPSGQYEGQAKAQSSFSHELASVRVPTIAHWVPASRQVLSDAPLLQRYVEGRLMYGLKLEEEDEYLNGNGSAGHVDGLVNQASDYNRGASQDTKIDTVAKAIAQLALAEYMASGIILNPSDWLGIILAKDNEGRYIFGNPAQMTTPQLWGVPVVATNSMTAGNVLVLDAQMAGYIADREDAVVRISESHEDFFVRNLIVLLCEERSTLVIERPTAIIHGALSHIA